MAADPANMGVIGLRVPGALAYRHLAIRFVSTACKMAIEGDPGEDESDFESEVVSAFGEAFNNVAVHAHRGLAPTPTAIEVDWDDERIVISIVDQGHAFDPARVSPPALDELPEHGMGLFIMNTCMDEVDYRPGPPNMLRLVKLRRRQGLLPGVPSSSEGTGADEPISIGAAPVSGTHTPARVPSEEPVLAGSDKRGSGVDLVTPAPAIIARMASARGAPHMRALVPEGDDRMVESSRRR